MTKVSFSAQFGDHNTAEAVFPYLEALKNASKGIFFDGFPFYELSFIFRVNGGISNFGSSSGIDNIDINKKEDYVSFDIVIADDDVDDMLIIINDAFDKVNTLLEEVYKKGKISKFDNDELKKVLNVIYKTFSSDISCNIETYREIYKNTDIYKNGEFLRRYLQSRNKI